MPCHYHDQFSSSVAVVRPWCRLGRCAFVVLDDVVCRGSIVEDIKVVESQDVVLDDVACRLRSCWVIVDEDADTGVVGRAIVRDVLNRIVLHNSVNTFNNDARTDCAAWICAGGTLWIVAADGVPDNLCAFDAGIDKRANAAVLDYVAELLTARCLGAESDEIAVYVVFLEPGAGLVVHAHANETVARGERHGLNFVV